MRRPELSGKPRNKNSKMTPGSKTLSAPSTTSATRGNQTTKIHLAISKHESAISNLPKPQTTNCRKARNKTARKHQAAESYRHPVQPVRRKDYKLPEYTLRFLQMNLATTRLVKRELTLYGDIGETLRPGLRQVARILFNFRIVITITRKGFVRQT
jgi:hypothetical protein